MHISITGRLGSGKSTISNILKANYGYEIYSTGAIQREIALRHKVSTLEMNQLMARDLRYDHAIDEAVAKISIDREDETIIFDSRMAWRFAVKSFKVFIAADPFVAASRVMENQRGEEEAYTDREDAKSKLIERSRLENERFLEIYGVDYFDYSNYNLVVDSSYTEPVDIANLIYDKFQDYCGSSIETHDIIMSPASLYPLGGTGGLDEETLEKYIEEKEYLHSFAAIAVFDGYHYIVDGHLKVLAAIKNGENLISVKLYDAEKYPFFRSTQNLISRIKADGISSAKEFEAAGKFQYKSYPGLYFSK